MLSPFFFNIIPIFYFLFTSLSLTTQDFEGYETEDEEDEHLLRITLIKRMNDPSDQVNKRINHDW